MVSTVTAPASVTLQTPSAVTKPMDGVTASQVGRALIVPQISRNVQSLNVLYAGPMRTVKRLLDPIDAAVSQDIDGMRLVYAIVSIWYFPFFCTLCKNLNESVFTKTQVVCSYCRFYPYIWSIFHAKRWYETEKTRINKSTYIYSIIY